MGTADIVTKEYMRENTVFADAFNYLIYNGKKVIDPAYLKEIDPAKLTEEQLDQFSTSLKEVMGYIKYSKNKEQLLKFLQTDTHRSIEMNAVRVIKTITNTPIEVSEEEEEIEMCKAIEDLIAESEARGRAEGEVKGEVKGMIEICLDMSFPKRIF